MSLPDLIRASMARLGASHSDIVARLGYRIETKGTRRLDAWLSGFDVPRDEQVERLAEALEVPPGDVRAAIAPPTDRYRLSLRLVPGFIATEYLEANLTPEQAMEVACKRARETHIKVALTTPDGQTYYLDATGGVSSVSEHEPRMKVR